VSSAEIASPEERASCDEIIGRWSAHQLGSERSSLLAVDRDEDLGRWYLRLRGEEKEVITVWLRIRQRTLQYETQVMPAPEMNISETFEYLLKKNSEIQQMRFALGPEDAIYLIGEIPVTMVTEAELDRIVGSSLAYVDSYFPTAMSIGFAGKYRRRRPPQTGS
jgi:hypothetical protein